MVRGLLILKQDSSNSKSLIEFQIFSEFRLTIQKFVHSCKILIIQESQGRLLLYSFMTFFKQSQTVSNLGAIIVMGNGGLAQLTLILAHIFSNCRHFHGIKLRIVLVLQHF